MGNNEKIKTSKSEESNSPAPPDQTNMHVYPDWAAMQAYYGPRVALPPYYNSAMVSGHAPHPYMWGPPQPMMAPYGGTYAAIYPHGGVYAHPGAPLAQTPVNFETPGKLSGNTDRGPIKKLKGFDGLAMSIGNGGENAEGGADQGMSQSSETEGTSDGSDGNTGKGAQIKRRRSREGTPIMGIGGKPETQASAGAATDTDSDSTKLPVITAGPSTVTGKVLGTILSPNMNTALELSNSSSIKTKTGTNVPHNGASLPAESWMQNERELKRERRKQSNRESARRSRLRKQAETEELAMKVESLNAENVTLKSELNRLAEKSKKLKLDNTILMDNLRNAKLRKEEIVSNEVDDKRAQPICTENLLSRVNNNGPVNRSHEEEADVYRNKNSSTKLHQLLDRKPRTDAVAAS